MSNWFKRLFSSRARTDAPADVAASTDDETTLKEARLAAGGSGPTAAGYGGQQVAEVMEGELSEYEPPSTSDD